jgi:hypothetical protein
MRNLYRVVVIVACVVIAGCSTASKEHGARNVQTGAAIAAAGNAPGAGIVGLAAVLYDFMREKPKFERSAGVNEVILKRIPGYASFYKRGLDNFKSGDLLGSGAVREANEQAYAAGKKLYLEHAEGNNKLIFAFSKASNLVKIITPEEALMEQKMTSAKMN